LFNPSVCYLLSITYISISYSSLVYPYPKFVYLYTIQNIPILSVDNFHSSVLTAQILDVGLLLPFLLTYPVFNHRFVASSTLCRFFNGIFGIFCRKLLSYFISPLLSIQYSHLFPIFQLDQKDVKRYSNSGNFHYILTNHFVN